MKRITAIGITVALLGIVGIIVSQTVKFTKTEVAHLDDPIFGGNQNFTVENPTTKKIVLFSGIVLLLAGGASAVFGNSKKTV